MKNKRNISVTATKEIHHFFNCSTGKKEGLKNLIPLPHCILTIRKRKEYYKIIFH
jgi:hypothetical protein